MCFSPPLLFLFLDNYFLSEISQTLLNGLLLEKFELVLQVKQFNAWALECVIVDNDTQLNQGPCI